MEQIDKELKKLTEKVKRRSETIKKSGLESLALKHLESRNEKIIKASQIAYKQPYQTSVKFDKETKERLIESYEHFLSLKTSSLKGLKEVSKANAEQLNKIVGHNKFNPEMASKVFNFIEEHQDLANILDYVGSGRKMSLVSELDENLIADNENELNEYLKSISGTGDFDYYEIERILTQGKAEKEE